MRSATEPGTSSGPVAHAILFTMEKKVVTMFEKVVHVAYGCGCVRTFHVKSFTPRVKCPVHHSEQISFTEEYHQRPVAAG